MESTSLIRSVLVCQFTVSFPTSGLCYKGFSYNDIFFVTLGLRSFLVCCIAYGIRYGIRYGNYVSFLFVIVFCCNYIIYMLDVVTFFDDFRITFYFGTLEWRMEITWKLRFVFVRHCDVCFIMLQLRYLFFQCSYAFWWRFYGHF